MNITITATVVAWYGAILGTFGFALSVLNYLRDRARVRVTGTADMIAVSGPNRGQRMVSVNIVNLGRRPITITVVAFHTKKSDGVPKEFEVPFTLAEGELRRFFLLQSKLEECYPLKSITRMAAVDASGRTWKGKFKYHRRMENGDRNKWYERLNFWRCLRR